MTTAIPGISSKGLEANRDGRMTDPQAARLQQLFLWNDLFYLVLCFSFPVFYTLTFLSEHNHPALTFLMTYDLLFGALFLFTFWRIFAVQQRILKDMRSRSVECITGPLHRTGRSTRHGHRIIEINGQEFLLAAHLNIPASTPQTVYYAPATRIILALED